jgi:hypothetical protein
MAPAHTSCAVRRYEQTTRYVRSPCPNSASSLRRRRAGKTRLRRTSRVLNLPVCSRLVRCPVVIVDVSVVGSRALTVVREADERRRRWATAVRRREGGGTWAPLCGISSVAPPQPRSGPGFANFVCELWEDAVRNIGRPHNLPVNRRKADDDPMRFLANHLALALQCELVCLLWKVQSKRTSARRCHGRLLDGLCFGVTTAANSRPAWRGGSGRTRGRVGSAPRPCTRWVAAADPCG